VADEDFSLALTKLLCAETFFLCSLTASREMYGKGYFALGSGEKQAVDQAVLSAVGANLNSITPQWLGVADPKKTGFQSPQSPDPSSADPS
jgi:hypothetical protein